MTDRLDPGDHRQADALGSFADALVDGHAPLAGNEIEAAMARAYHALNDDGYERAAKMPETIKRQIWEDLMTTSTVAPSNSVPLAGSRRAERSRQGSLRIAPAVEPVARTWQAVASFTIVLVFLATLVALAWQAGTGGNPDDPAPTSFAQGLYDDDDISTYPMMPEECVPNGEVDDEVDPADRSINDWVTPEYGPADAVPHETGLAIQKTYMNYVRCEWDHFRPDDRGEGTPLPLTAGPSPEMMTYFSDRLRFDHMYNSLSPEQQAELDAYRCMPRIDTILHNFPLPVNQPQDYAIWSLLPYIDEIDELGLVFGPADVYLLPDGRYAAIQGTVTTAALDDPNAVTRDDHLLFIAFVEEDGRYYIDEMFTLLAPDMDRFFQDGRNGTILMDCD